MSKTPGDPCEHERVQQDHFSKLTGVCRLVPGDCVCAKCGEPLPLWWNGGRPQAVEPPSEVKPRKT
jgi:hypothetical protein